MSTNTDAYLMYGYDLGGEDGFRMQGVEEDCDWEPQWLEDDDLITSAQTRLLASVGFTETDYKVAGYIERKRIAEALVGVTLETHCSCDYPMYVLSAKTITAYRGDVRRINLTELQETVDQEDLDGKLARALEVLDIRPVQQKPAWLLCSYWAW